MPNVLTAGCLLICLFLSVNTSACAGGFEDSSPWPSFECEVCEALVPEIEAIVNENSSIGETAFHAQVDALCDTFFVDSWISAYCQYWVDENALELYEIFVKRQNVTDTCIWLGACSSRAARNKAKPLSGSISHKQNGLKVDNSSYSFIVISDMHIGQDNYVVWLMEQAVAKINGLISKENIKFAFVTGDITNTAMPNQWKQARALLDTLRIPYFPILGNHDIWSYNSTYQEANPTGDAQFARTFADRFTHPQLPGATLVYNNKTTWNPLHNITSWFQNWELQYKDFVFYGLDWISRSPAVRELGYKGGWPGAGVQDFPGGTLPWFEERLKKLRGDSRKIVMLQHHPFAMPFFIPEAIYSFSAENKEKIYKVMTSTGSIDRFWGLIAGHLHIWHNGTAFTPTYRQWLTEAMKIGSAITLVSVSNGNIVHLTKIFGYDY
jgi:hypothetical protein